MHLASSIFVRSNIKIIPCNRDSKYCAAMSSTPPPLQKNVLISPVTEFKEFERRFRFKPRFKYGWFHLKLYQMFQDLSRRLI